jgi:hypothetical protein
MDGAMQADGKETVKCADLALLADCLNGQGRMVVNQSEAGQPASQGIDQSIY